MYFLLAGTKLVSVTVQCKILTGINFEIITDTSP